MTCGLCGHEMTLERCGSAAAGDVDLCHADDHDCYHAWTVYKTRPGDLVQDEVAYFSDEPPPLKRGSLRSRLVEFTDGELELELQHRREWKKPYSGEEPS